MLVRLFFLISASLLLVSCQFTSKRTTTAEVKEIDVSQEDSIIKTVPLLKPAVQSLHSQALVYYQASELDKALITLKRGHQIQANSPQVMILMAEILLQQGEYSDSFYWSRLVSQEGPSKGPICEKAWRILALSAEMLGEVPVQSHALEQKENCLVREANRF